MIYASLNAKEGNYQYPAAIKTALDFLLSQKQQSFQ